MSRAAEIKRGSGICEITLSGIIKPGDAAKFQRLLTKDLNAGADYRLSLCLDSRGGSYPEAIKFIDLMKVEASGQGITTRVRSGAICASACALIFLAGSYNENVNEMTTIPSRFLDVNSKGLGFHQPFFELEVGNYDEKDVLEAASIANRQIANLMARNEDSLFPNSLLALALNTDKDKLFEIDTVQHAGRWSITLTDFKVHTSKFSPQLAYQGCVNTLAWAEEAESKRAVLKSDSQSKDISGLRISSLVSWAGKAWQNAQ